MSEIDNLKKEIRELQENDRAWAWFNESLKKQLKLNAANEQIAALKAALIDREMRLLVECNGDCKLADCHKCERSEAILQLAHELPDIDWEDKQ
jgi:hypothetical protein